jgi:hypothetical protein
VRGRLHRLFFGTLSEPKFGQCPSSPSRRGWSKEVMLSVWSAIHGIEIFKIRNADHMRPISSRLIEDD